MFRLIGTLTIEKIMADPPNTMHLRQQARRPPRAGGSRRAAHEVEVYPGVDHGFAFPRCATSTTRRSAVRLAW